LLRNPSVNKATAYTEAEKESLGLVGLVPDVSESIETQLSKVLWQLDQKTSNLERYIYLMNLLEINETLLYRALMSDPAGFLEIVCDPTIGEACSKFDHILHRPHGLYLSITGKGHVRDVLRNWPVKDVRFIFVTDAGRISVLVTRAPTAWAFRSASCSSIPRLRECRPKGFSRCTWTLAAITRPISRMLCTLDCASGAHQRKSSTLLATNLSMRCRKCFRTAASISGIGRVPTQSLCWPAIATKSPVTTTISKEPLV